MKALYFGTTGSLDHLIVAEIPRPIPRADEALVRICAAAINPSDPKNVLGKMPTTKLPCIPGRDFSGIVVDGPPNWRGKEVLGTGGDLGFGRQGTHAEFSTLPVEALVEKPPHMSFESAAALGLGYLTAWYALVTAGHVAANDIVLVIGATGAVGSSAIKIARHLGARRILGTLRSEADRARARSVPVDDWLVLEKGPLPEQVSALTGGHGADLVLNAIGGSTCATANTCLAHRGRHIVIASAPPQVSIDLVDFYHREAHLIGVDTLKLSFGECAGILRDIIPLVDAGTLTVPEIEVIPLDQAVLAYRSLDAGTARTKQVIHFDLG